MTLTDDKHGFRISIMIRDVVEESIEYNKPAFFLLQRFTKRFRPFEEL